jgi:5-methylcytosine-specific restriction endonuclease McrA
LGRPSGPRTRCNGLWTEARFTTFVKNALRQASRKWAPNQTIKKKANVARGVYECAECKRHVPLTVRIGANRKNNIFIDHINPIVDPNKGFEGFDKFVENLFCEEDNLQVLCGECHDIKSLAERVQAKERRRLEKELTES